MHLLALGALWLEDMRETLSDLIGSKCSFWRSVLSDVEALENVRYYHSEGS